MTERTQSQRVEEIERARVAAPELSWALREVNRLNAEIDGVLARLLDLRHLDHAALGHVMNAVEPLGPAELSGRLGISTGSATELVDRLERAGHVSRHRDVHDRRRVALQATPAAVERVLGELAPLFTMLDALAEEFTPEQQEVIIRYLRAAASRMQAFVSHPDVDG